MASGIVRHRRRQAGNAGAPSSMQPGEIAINEIDGIVYYGQGVSSGNSDLASTIISIAGAAKQNINSNLTALSNLVGSADTIPYFTAPNTLSTSGLTSFSRTLLSQATAAAARSSLGSAASGSNSDITALTGLTTALSVAQGGTGSKTASDARTALGLGTIATQAANGVNITGGTISGVTFDSIDGGTF